MVSRGLILAAWILLSAVSFPSGMSGAGDPNSLSVLTFNIRYGTAKDPGFTWDLRKESVLKVIETQTPDLTGLQEALDFQLEYLEERLGGSYGLIGEGREGGTQGEYSAILYNRNRFRVARAGRFWLSETPDVAGSKSWSGLPRMVTWVELVEKETGKRLIGMNTHFSHVSDEAREKSARTILDQIEVLFDPKTPIVLTGDFNCRPDSAPYNLLADPDDGPFAAAQRASMSPPRKTFHKFKGPSKDAEGGPIDWILYRGGLQTYGYEILDGTYSGTYPSDHFPVSAVLKWTE